jgi:hypothetical protein
MSLPRSDDHIPWERLLVIGAVAFLLGALFGCENPAALQCNLTGADTSKMAIPNTTDSVTIIVTTEWCE